MGWSDFLSLLHKAPFYISLGRQSGSTSATRRMPKKTAQGGNLPAGPTHWLDGHQPLHFPCLCPQRVSPGFVKNLDTLTSSTVSNRRKVRNPFVRLAKRFVLPVCKRGFTRSQADHFPVNTGALLRKVGLLFQQLSCVAARKSLIMSLNPSVKRLSQLPPFPLGLQMPRMRSKPSHTCRALGIKAVQGMTHISIRSAARRKPDHHTLWKEPLKRTSCNAQKLFGI